MSNLHVLVLPFPAQGHVNPLMHFSQKLAKHGFKITFVNTDFNHKRVMNATTEHSGLTGSPIKLVSVPDGLGPEDDRNDLAKLCLAMLSTMPSMLLKLLETINGLGGGINRITCIVADSYMAWALEVANKLGIKGALLCPSPAAVLALEDNIPKLIHDGILDSNGFPIIKGKFQLSPSMPMIDTANIPWYCCVVDRTSQKIIHDYMMQIRKFSYLTDWWLCNTASELEPGALAMSPKFLPVGPLMEDTETNSLGQLWQEDHSCLSWLDQHSPRSVIYVAFGSTTIFDSNQIKELALGLELFNKPFLWVVRSDANSSNTENTYPDGFQGNCGKIVQWAPQQKVLSHPAIACFITHCGWNSTIEGLSNGVPLLCWPYFADQFLNKTYICDIWKVGLSFDLDKKGLILREEVKKKVEQLLGDENLRARSMNLKEMTMKNIAEGGSSSQNFSKFIKWTKE